ncbi:MAG: N-acetylmuramoyl-L-alanine amidase [Bacteroidales bacterium]|nr:N-acetylmuramoyl-L-alanine amidase [Bacteroidales bacterium]
MIVLIDNGHGIDTAGKRSPDGRFREYLWNRWIAADVCARLLADGIETRLLVPETNDIALSTRVRRANKVCTEAGAANVLLVSVHANAAGDGSRWMNAQGWSAYTSPGKTKADTAAECFYDAFERAFPDRKIRRDYSDGDRDWEANFTILKNTKCPAVLLENFFYDNREECSWLLSPYTQYRIVSAICDGVKRYAAL